MKNKVICMAEFRETGNCCFLNTLESRTEAHAKTGDGLRVLPTLTESNPLTLPNLRIAGGFIL